MGLPRQARESPKAPCSVASMSLRGQPPLVRRHFPDTPDQVSCRLFPPPLPPHTYRPQCSPQSSTHYNCPLTSLPPHTGCRLLEERAHPLTSTMFSSSGQWMHPWQGVGSQTAILRAYLPHKEGAQEGPTLTGGKVHSLPKVSSGKAAQTLLWGLKGTFPNNLLSVSKENNWAEHIWEKRLTSEEVLGTKVYQRKWFQLTTVCAHQPWHLGPQGNWTLFSLYQNKHITGCVLSSVAFGNPLLGIDYFLSEHPPCCKVSTGYGYLISPGHLTPFSPTPPSQQHIFEDTKQNNNTFRQGTKCQSPFSELNLNII